MLANTRIQVQSPHGIFIINKLVLKRALFLGMPEGGSRPIQLFDQPSPPTAPQHRVGPWAWNSVCSGGCAWLCPSDPSGRPCWGTAGRLRPERQAAGGDQSRGGGDHKSAALGPLQAFVRHRRRPKSGASWHKVTSLPPNTGPSFFGGIGRVEFY